MTDTTALIAEGRAVASEIRAIVKEFREVDCSPMPCVYLRTPKDLRTAMAAEILTLRSHLDSAARDAARLDWLMRNVSGAEYRRLGLAYGDIAEMPALIDAALTQHTALAEPRG